MQCKNCIFWERARLLQYSPQLNIKLKTESYNPSLFYEFNLDTLQFLFSLKKQSIYDLYAIIISELILSCEKDCFK